MKILPNEFFATEMFMGNWAVHNFSCLEFSSMNIVGAIFSFSCIEISFSFHDFFSHEYFGTCRVKPAIVHTSSLEHNIQVPRVPNTLRYL